MAADALTAFLQRDFIRTNHALLSLTSDSSSDLHNVKVSPDDPRIRHNALVAQFYHTPSRLHVDNIIFYVSEFLPQEQRPKTVDQFFDYIVTDPSALKMLCSHVGPVSLYNVAVIAYHRCLINAAAIIGDLLFEKVEAMDEWLALNICFLLTDIHLRLSNVSSAAAALSQAEKLLPTFSRPLLNSSNNNSNNNSNENNDSNSNTNTNKNSNSNSNSNHSDEHGDHLADFQILSPDWPGRSFAILERPHSYEHTKFCMHLYNARLSAFHEGTDGTRSIRKEAKSAVLAADNAHSRPTSAALLVKARVEQNLFKSLRILASIVNHCPASMLPKVRPLALNSLGVLHHRLGRHSLAACYFEHSRRAFTGLFDPSQENSFQLSVLSTAKDTHVAYNLALQYMNNGQFSTALKLLTTCARADTVLAKRSPLLWIRIAECCVGMESSHADTRSSLSLEGKGRSRRMIMRVSDQTDVICMEYAASCARAALDIMNGDKKRDDARSNADSKEMKSSWSEQMKGSGSPTSARMQRSVAEELEYRGTAWLLVAYASLSFDALAVIEACDGLQKLYPKSDHERCTLAQLYAAEAFCMLRRPKDALKRMVPLSSGIVSVDSHIREAAHVDIALTYASNEDLVMASRAAKESLKMYTTGGAKGNGKVRKQAMFAAAYIFLRNGDTGSAREALRLIHSSGA